MTSEARPFGGCSVPADALRVLSISHRTAPLELLDGVALSPAEVRALLVRLQGAGIPSIALVTCNRSELYWCARESEDDRTVERLLREAWRNPPADLAGCSVRASGIAAARHLFRVAAGLESLLVGEAEVLGQLRTALELAEAESAAGPTLAALFRAALRFGGRARASTRIGAGALSVASAAVRGLRRAHPELGSLAVMVLGVGHTGLKTARHLRSEKLGRLLLANRTRARADEVAVELDAEVIPWEEHAAHIADVDAVLVAVQVAEPVVTPELVRAAMNGRTRPLTLVDLSLPRAVAHAVEEVPGVTLIDLSRLEEQVAESRARRESEIPRVEALLEAALLEYEEEAAEQAARPLTAELRVRAEAIRKAEVERAVAAGLGDPDVLDYVTRRVVDRMLRAPSTALRQTSRARTSGGPPCLECVFGDQERNGHDAG